MNDTEKKQYIVGMLADMHLTSRTTVDELTDIVLSLKNAEPDYRQKMILGAILSGCTEGQQRNGLRQATAVSVKIHEAMG